MRISTLATILLLFLAITFAVRAEEKITKASIKSSVWCETCEKTVTKGLSKIDGISDLQIDLEKKLINLSFDETKTSLDDIREKISNLGYDADDVKANKRSYQRLPNCCKNPEDRKK